MMDEKVPEIRGFTAVDQAGDPEAFVRFLNEVSARPVIRRYKELIFDQLAPQEGDQVLDLGCGTGDDPCALARRVGPTGRVVGVDASAAMIAAARRRRDPTLPVEFRVGDAYRLEFADGAFDRCRDDRMFQHLVEPEPALAELVRVARSGSRVVVGEPDFGTLFVDAPDRSLTERILKMRREAIASPWIARRLPRLLRALSP